MVAAARSRSEIEGIQLHLVEGEAQRLPFDDAAFDVVLAVTTLCFVRDAKLEFCKDCHELRAIWIIEG